MNKGTWVADYYHPYVGMIIKCSNCQDKVKHDKPNPKFCPSCGSEMTNFDGVPEGWGRVLDSF
ncbi:hypothetical protein A2Z67_00015 [Candidatus Woesebacteria bacterium RBG_13_36_22]|uniref:Uncharacterized protein n=1 Tax=Candidatus Woesebacteria bacterium RBG_13_36_22 TaxID=1802478 RepID=A0A1F7X8H0_9BACT|nr:MAG: hypothetical protein A2Z67_00015 [Candidatus Woesebacteria bacterium RBG_13_36_22]